MDQDREPAVGIDLGTTYSVVAHLTAAERPETLLSAEGDKLTPSVVFFEGTEPVVGKEAFKAIATDADQVAYCIKRELGQRAFGKAIDGKQYPPEVLQGWILNKLRVDAMKEIGAVDKVVITVPAYFDEVRRKATQDAGYIAGFEVLDIINEPTAAALAHGFRRGAARLRETPNSADNILVYDLGGGTFDVTIMEIGGNHYTTLATDGDVHLGGRDWDQRLMDHVAERCISQIGFDPRHDPTETGRLWRSCEEAKRTLSARSKAVIGCDIDGHPVRVEMTRDQFEEATQDLLERTAFTTQQTLRAAGLEWGDVAALLMIGGSTRMPAVERMLRTMSGLNPSRSASPDESVAHGAALHAGYLLKQRAGVPAQFTITNVNSHSLGVVGRDSKSDRDLNAILIPRNTPLPATAKRVFKTHTGSQKSIRVQIVEGESQDPRECSEIGRCSVREVPANLPQRTPVEVEFRYQENGRLTVVVSIAGQTMEHELLRENGLTQDQLDDWRQHISGVPW